MDSYVLVEKERTIMMKRALTACVAITMAGATCAATAQLQLQEIMRTSITPATGEGNNWFIGRNLTAVAWDGNDLYVGGSSFNDAGSAIAKVTPQVGTTSGLFQLSGNFGFQATGATRGIFGLDVGNGVLAVGTDFGAGNANGIRMFNTSGAALGNSTFDNRANGVAYDARDNRFYAHSIGSGRMIKVNTDGTTYNDGVRDWNTATGPIFFAGSTEHRGLDHDGDGTIFYRAANNVRKVTEAGDGQMLSANNTELVAANNPFIAGQNLAYIGSDFGNFVIYNDRAVTGTGQAFLDVMKAIDVNGNAMSIDFDFINAFGNPVDGNGFYDFSYHAASQTLAIADFLQNQVYIFQVVPTPSTIGALALGGLVASRRRRS